MGPYGMNGSEVEVNIKCTALSFSSLSLGRIPRNGGEPVKKISPEKGYILVSSLGAWMTHLMGPYLTIWLRSLGISFAQIGFFQSVSSLLTLITDFPTGGLADRYG